MAARLSTLTRLTLRLNRAQTLGGLLSEACVGAARIFRTPAVVCAPDADGVWLAASVDGPRRDRHREPLDAAGQPSGAGTYGDISAEQVGLVAWPAGDTVRVVAVTQRPDRGPTLRGGAHRHRRPGLPGADPAGAVGGAAPSRRSGPTPSSTDLALTLQRSLLPRRLPRVAGTDIAVRYVPASDTAEIGGDFYDLSQFDDQLLVAVGDVGGHSLHAATVMAELRHATRAYVAEGHSPAEVIDRLRVFMRRCSPTRSRPSACWHGHDDGPGAPGQRRPPRPADDRRRPRSPRSPIACRCSAWPRPGPRRSSWTLPDGATMLLYTDGLVERRDEHIDRGIDRLVAAAANPDDDLEVYCDRWWQPSARTALRRHRRGRPPPPLTLTPHFQPCSSGWGSGLAGGAPTGHPLPAIMD